MQCFSVCNPAEITRALVQIQFLAAYLSLGDMHDENIGIEENFNPIIIDFMMSNYFDPKTKFLHEANTSINQIYNDLLTKCAASERLQIAKDSMHQWNFLEKMDETLKLIDEEKANFGRKELDFEKATKDLEEFVRKLKSNIEDLIN